VVNGDDDDDDYEEHNYDVVDVLAVVDEKTKPILCQDLCQGCSALPLLITIRKTVSA
jgi:hypothetical protein